MTVTVTQPKPSRATHRDGAIDLIRALSLVVVVILHALMVGAETGADGELRTSVALVGEPVFTVISWPLQVMPLFFLAGGFASLSQWRRMRDRGSGWQEYIASRSRRLVVPAAVMIAVVSVAITLADAAGLAPALVDEASLRAGQPLWFLAVYLGVTALVPVTSWLHERHRVATLLALGGGIIGVEALAMTSGTPALGYANLAFVWLFVHQLGYVLLDGEVGAGMRGALVLPLAALAGVVVCLVTGASADMFANLNPPTLVLALFAVFQFGVLRVAKPCLDRIAGRPAIARAAAALNAKSMTIYLWHMPLMLTLVGASAAVGLPMPEVHSFAWWATRVLWIAVVAMLLLPLTRWLAPLEHWSPDLVLPTSRVSDRGLASLSVLAGIIGIGTVLVLGYSQPVTVAAALGLLGLGIASGNRLSPPRFTGRIQTGRQPSDLWKREFPQAPRPPRQ